MSDFKTIILRFRDLATSTGETITAHKELIDDDTDPYVWWAWWCKAGEKIPSDAFIKILAEIKEHGSLEIYLFDTGQSLFFKAHLIDIEWERDFSKRTSPEPNKTPSYYNEREYPAWFKISSIEEVDSASILDNYSYVKNDEFFSSGSSIFEAFYGKVIVSSEELRHQERTIWFVRERKEDDPNHTVMLYDSSRLFQTNFSEKVASAKGDTFLWLSDLHFSDDFHEFPKNDSDPYRKSLLMRIQDELEKEDAEDLAGLIITGDLTWKASVDEFDFALDFIEQIKSRFSITNDQIVICPGNHDIRFTDSPWEKDAEVGVATNDAKENYISFYKKLFAISPNEFLCSGKKIVTRSGFCLDIVGLNSSYLHQAPGVFQGHGFVGEDQRECVAKSMRWNPSEEDSYKTFRVAALHHHIVPVLPDIPKFKEVLSTVYDASSLLDWFAMKEIDLVLHGHMHYASKCQVIRDIPNTKEQFRINIVSMGSSGVKRDHVAKKDYNSISLIKCNSSSATVKAIKVCPHEQIKSNREMLEAKIPYMNKI